MGEESTESRWFRVAFGRPRLWNGIVWIVLGVCFLVVTASGRGPGSGYILAAFWALLGSVMLVIATRDRKLGRGAYAPPVSAPSD